MKNTRRWLCGAALVAFALLSTACGSVQQAAQRQQRKNDLLQIGLAYHSYLDANIKGPAKAEDLLPYIENNAVLLQKMKSDYTIIWGVDLKNPTLLTQGTKNTVLGYESSAPTSGGQVLMCDGSVEQMTAAEFKAAPQAKSGGTGK
jgi:prepilin-type processing-associated H-X9-DG protein